MPDEPILQDFYIGLRHRKAAVGVFQAVPFGHQVHRVRPQVHRDK